MAKTKCDMTIRYCIITTWHWDTTAWHTWQCDATQRSDTAMWHYNKVTQQNEASLQSDTTMKWHSKTRHHCNEVTQQSKASLQCDTTMKWHSKTRHHSNVTLQWSDTAKQGITAMWCDTTMKWHSKTRHHCNEVTQQNKASLQWQNAMKQCDTSMCEENAAPYDVNVNHNVTL